MILFCGIPSEPPLEFAIRAAEQCGFEHVVFNQRAAHFCDMVLEVAGGRPGGVLWAGERQWRLDGFTGVYTRLMESADLPENRARGRRIPDPALVDRSAFLHEILNLWIDMADCRVVNRTAAMASNASKPFQAQLIRKVGFPVPPTLVTNEPDAVLDFVRRHGRVIFKSISSVRSIVQQWQDHHTAVLPRIRDLPTQFQAFISGVNVRVHVVGQAVFATEITCDAVDYRYAGRQDLDVALEAIELPRDVAERCFALAVLTELPLAGIDLRRTSEGEWHCFEINPSPGFTYYAGQTGQPVADAIAELMLAA